MTVAASGFLESFSLCRTSLALHLYSQRQSTWLTIDASRSLVPEQCSKLSVGQIVRTALQYLNAYTPKECSQLNASFKHVQTKLEEKRSCCLLKRIFIIFLSSLYNYYQGFGFVDSLTLVQNMLVEIKKAQRVTQTGQIEFSQDEKALLSELFCDENRKALLNRKKELFIAGKKVVVKHYGINIPVFEVDLFPGIVFKFHDRYSDQTRKRYEMAQRAQKVCQEHALTQLIVPPCSLLEIPSGETSIAVFAQKKFPLESGKIAQKTAYANQEPYLEEIARQLTLFICKTGFSDVRWDNIPLLGEGSDLQVILIDLEPEEEFGAQGGLIGWKVDSGYGVPTPGLISCLPRYADTIYRTAKEHLLKEAFENMKGALEEARDKANTLAFRRKEIEAFHKAHGITIQMPAIPEHFLASLEIDEKTRGIFREVISDINAVIAKQKERYTNLVDARVWRLTGDAQTADSNWHKTIYNHHYEIRKILLPKLQEAGIVHSIISKKDAEELDLQYDFPLGQYDQLIQF